MSILAALQFLRSACAVFFRPRGSVTAEAQQQGCSRQTLYREASQAFQAVEGSAAQAQRACLQQQLALCQEQLQQLQQRLQQAVVLSKDLQAQFAATAQAIGVSLAQAHALLAVLLGSRTPSVPTLGRLSHQAARRCAVVLQLLDPACRARARQIAADEIFSGTKPILMTLEQDSLCWLGGQLSRSRDGQAWAQQLQPLTAAEQVTADGGKGIRKGLQQVNQQRAQAGQAAIASQRDHFHALQRGQRALCHARQQARQTFKRAEQLQRVYDHQGRTGVPRSAAQGLQLKRAWLKAEQAMDRWSAQEKAFERLRLGLRLFTPLGELNSRERATAEVQAALAGQPGPDWKRARQLLGAEAFTFLDQVQQQLAALPVGRALREAAVRVEGLRRRPELLSDDNQPARRLRGELLVAEVVLALAGKAGEYASKRVRGVLRGAWRASSLVEGLNSVVRMHQGRQKRLTQELLDLKRLYWNTHVFRAGKRKGSSPYGRLGLVLPQGGWWQLLQRTPEQLRQEMAQANPALAVERLRQEVSAQEVAA